MTTQAGRPATLLPKGILRETLRSGSIAALVMAPLGLTAYLLGLRVNEYGIKVVLTIFGQDLPRGLVFLAFLVEHFLISWTVTVPLLLLLVTLRSVPSWLVGASYGLGFYLVVNSLLLPWAFGDATPWHLGVLVIVPSLVVHLAYGLSVWWTSRGFVTR